MQRERQRENEQMHTNICAVITRSAHTHTHRRQAVYSVALQANTITTKTQTTSHKKVTAFIAANSCFHHILRRHLPNQTKLNVVFFPFG